MYSVRVFFYVKKKIENHKPNTISLCNQTYQHVTRLSVPSSEVSETSVACRLTSFHQIDSIIVDQGFKMAELPEVKIWMVHMKYINSSYLFCAFLTKIATIIKHFFKEISVKIQVNFKFYWLDQLFESWCFCCHRPRKGEFFQPAEFSLIFFYLVIETEQYQHFR